MDLCCFNEKKMGFVSVIMKEKVVVVVVVVETGI